jgi:hypothetical protein
LSAQLCALIPKQNNIIHSWNFEEKPKSITRLKEFRTEEMPSCVSFSPNKGKYMFVATHPHP